MHNVREIQEKQIIGITTIGRVRNKAIYSHRTYPGTPCSLRNSGRIIEAHKRAFTTSETILKFSNGEEEKYVYSRKQI